MIVTIKIGRLVSDGKTRFNIEHIDDNGKEAVTYFRLTHKTDDEERAFIKARIDEEIDKIFATN